MVRFIFVFFDVGHIQSDNADGGIVLQTKFNDIKH